ncbi:LysM domain-containing protein [Acinetobacter calcoaceticus]|uniref:LysM domain-containing protein n=1 Tax=Acinetobacter calcoaceticus TaxID=471 RepID=A0A4R1Y141_ACICA|nr:LysM domain-containing protein [Acinetobacter calcoaceticus]
MYKPSQAVMQPSASHFFKISLLTSALAALGLTTGCSTTPTKPASSSQQNMGMLDANSLSSLEDLLSATDMRAVEGDRLQILKHGDVWKRMTVGFKMDLEHWDPRIDAQRSWFISRQPYLDRLSARASRYLYHTVKEAERRGLPTELALLPIIESSYDPAATSSAAAAGMWQFIPSTGKVYGLRQTGLYDGRRDVVESTRAAYEFLGSLYNQFGSWELALAAYNAGPGRIQQAINRNQAAGLPTDYWSLKLPQETMNYVPRFLAVAQIIKSPQRYGASLPPIANRPHFREVAVPAGSQLNQIANLTGLSRAELYALNPGHRGETVDASSPMRILIPADLNPNIDAKLKTLQGGSSVWTASSNSNMPLSTTAPATTQASSVITTTPASVKQPSTPTYTANTLSNTTFNNNNQPKTTASLPRNTPQGSNALASFASNADVPSAPRIPVAITQAANVKPVSIEPPISNKEREQIQAAVKAENSKETVQQVLQPRASAAETDAVVKEITALAPQGTEVVDPLDGKIKLTAIQTSQSVAEQQGKEVSVGFSYPRGVAENTPASSVEAQLNQGKAYVKNSDDILVVAPKGKRSTYTVVAGDTLAIIAAKNGVNWRDVAKWNQVDPNGTLFAGTTLYLYDANPASSNASTPSSATTTSARPTSYVVKPNDSLTGVAEQFGLSVQQLASFNNLSVSSNLWVDQKLNLVETSNSNNKANDSSANTKDQKNNGRSDVKVKTKVYVVKRGEYLKLIADRYAMSNQELADLTDGLSAGSSLLVGQKINVPLQELSATKDSKVETKVESTKKEFSYKTESYKVQRGETLSSIAAQSKLSLNELAELNQIAPNKGLMVGQSIKIPAGTTTPDSYTVQPGDSLSAVASKYNLSVSKVADLNGLSVSSGVMVGQKLKLTGEPDAKVKQNNAADDADSHTVKAGETLASVAKKYYMQPNYLADLNGLSRTANLRAGQRLKIDRGTAKQFSAQEEKKQVEKVVKAPVSSKSTEKYTVKAGESLTSIAARVGVSVPELAAMNGLTAKTALRRGQSILIPKTVVSYTVKSGDSLIRLASKYGVGTEQLAEMNDMKPNANLRIGAVIKVPNL